MSHIASSTRFAVPGIIKRNMTLFALSQSFTGTGMQFAYGFGPLMVLALTHSALLSGLSVALIGLGRFISAYPVGKVTDAFGRRAGIHLGLSLAMVGGIVTGLSMTFHSVAVFIGGMLLFSMGMAAAQQLRVAATDMFPPQQRAQALGFVALGSLLGLLISPWVIKLAQNYAYSIGQDPLGLPWYMLPCMIIPGMVMIRYVRPDPKEIGQNLADYYPGYTPPPRRAGPEVEFSARRLMRNPRVRLAILANFAGQGNMSVVMVLTSLVLHHHGYSLSEIAFSHMFHSLGMFAFTIPLGRIADRVGREAVLIPGVGIALVAACMVAFSGEYWLVTLGTFLVGLGWAAGNVAATALIADSAETHERGRAIGVNETAAGFANMFAACATGPLIELGGLSAAGVAAVVIALPPIILFATQRMAPRARRERTAPRGAGE